MPIRKILVPLVGRYDLADPESLEKPALETAFMVGRRMNAHVEVMCIEAQRSEARAHLTSWMPQLAINDLINDTEEESERRRTNARALFDTIAARIDAPRISTPDHKTGFSVHFLETVGTVQASLPARGRLADLIVTAFPPPDGDLDKPLVLEVALRETGRPLLISQATATMDFGRKVAVAWNGSAEASRAVGLAMDFLTDADEVIVISVNENGSMEADAGGLAEYLDWHGIGSRTVTMDGSPYTAGRMILEQVAEADADMLVMGAYTRNRVQRVIFGGVTEAVLAQMPVPVLMVD